MEKIRIDELLKELDKHTFKEFHIHHTWKPTHKDFTGSNHMSLQQGMKSYHMGTNGWSDIAQHLTLFPDGVFITGRPFNIQPASIRGWNNRKPLMVEMIGNFDKPGTGEYNDQGYDNLKGKQRENLLKLIKYFIEHYGQKSIVFHRDHPQAGKTCPGTSLDKLQLIGESIKLEEKKDKLYRVQVGAYSVKDNAEAMLKRLKDKGFNGFISEVDMPKEEEVGKSKYYKVGDAHVIETTPDNISIEVIGDTLQGKGAYGINGTFFDTKTAPVESPDSCVFIAMNDSKAISSNAEMNGYKGPARATMIYHTSGMMGFRQLKNINSIRNVTKWAIGGYMVKPYMDFKNEQIPGSINYKTAHTYIGYDDKGYIYLIVKPNHMIKDIVPLLNDFKITNAIVLDGGGSSQLNHPDGSYRSTRKINTAILLKEI